VVFLARTVDMLKEFGEDKRLDLNSKITTYGATLLIDAIGGRNVNKVVYLLEKGVDLNKIGKSIYGDTLIPIHMAIQFDYTDGLQIVKLLVNHPQIDLKVKNNENMNPLEWAQHLRKTEVVKLIKEKTLP
jgi:ankyrin repeat protein